MIELATFPETQVVAIFVAANAFVAPKLQWLEDVAPVTVTASLVAAVVVRFPLKEPLTGVGIFKTPPVNVAAPELPVVVRLFTRVPF